MGSSKSQITVEQEMLLPDLKEEKWLPVERKEIIEDSKIMGTLAQQ